MDGTCTGLFDAGVSAGEVRSELEVAMRLAGDMGGAHAVLFVMSAATKVIVSHRNG